jgi:hypothetical protein
MSVVLAPLQIGLGVVIWFLLAAVAGFLGGVAALVLFALTPPVRRGD